MDRVSSPSPDLLDAYRRGVAALLEGRLDAAARELAGPREAGLPEARLAWAKLLLEREDGAAARGILADLLAVPPSDPGMHAYLLILEAAAAARCGDREAADRSLEAASRRDARMDGVARALRRRLEKDRPPRVHF